MTYKELFTYNHLYQSALKCFKGVNWKYSTQQFKANLGINIRDLQHRLLNHTYKSKGYISFTLNERGKTRNIQGVYFEERIVQRCLCDYYLTPLLSKSLIYDNGASIKGKGISFTLNRLEEHLQKYYRKYGNKGYCLKIDFSSYFENIDHSILKEQLTKKIEDDEIKSLVFYFIDNCKQGLNLGSQVSQICALYYTNELDHYIKEKLHIKYYGRYMDDSYILLNSKEKLKQYLIEIESICNKLHIILNKDKTKIISLKNGIVFLKRRFVLTDSGKILKFIDNKSFKREKSKLTKLTNREDKETSFLSWKGTYLGYDEYFKMKYLANLISII